MGFLDKLWKGWGKCKSTLSQKIKKAPVVKKLAKKKKKKAKKK